MVKVKIVIFFSISVILVCCTQNEEFKVLCENWQKDTIGCDSIKKRIYEEKFSLLEENIVGIRSTTAISYLGKPNEKFNENDIELYSYFVEPGIQCIIDSETEIDVFRIALEVKDKKILGIRKILP